MLRESLPALRPGRRARRRRKRPGSLRRRSLRTCASSRTSSRSVLGECQQGIGATRGEYVVISNPDAIPEPGRVATLVAFADAHPRAASPARGCCNRRDAAGVAAAASRRRRDDRPAYAAAALLFPPLRWQRRHYLLDARTDEPLQVDTMLGAFLLMRRTMLEEIGGWDAGYSSTSRTSTSATAR